MDPNHWFILDCMMNVVGDDREREIMKKFKGKQSSLVEGAAEEVERRVVRKYIG